MSLPIIRTSERSSFKRCDLDCTCGRHNFPLSKDAIHQRLRAHYGKASEKDCVDCGKQARDWSCKSNCDGSKFEHYEPRCRSCHHKYDYQFRWGKPEYRKTQSVKAREKALKQWSDPNHRVNISAKATGKHPSEETRKKMSIAKIGNQNRRKQVI